MLLAVLKLFYTPPTTTCSISLCDGVERKYLIKPICIKQLYYCRQTDERKAQTDVKEDGKLRLLQQLCESSAERNIAGSRQFSGEGQILG